MSARPATARTAAQRRGSRTARAARARRRLVWRRRLLLLAGVAIAAIIATVVMAPWADKAVKEFSLPLRHEDVIRQQADAKKLDPTLIAGVIYVESHFIDQTSHAGAKGLMQLMPSTADYIARKSGGTRFQQGDLATPQINIAYGTWYLRYLLRKYDNNTILTLAAYNAGEGKVDEWRAVASARGEQFRVASHIPFQETRDYVHRVLSARAEYRRTYADELAL